MNILTLGRGFIASHLPYPQYDGRFLSERIALDLDKLLTWEPEVIVNCIGFGGIGNIDDCEKERERTFYANTIFPIHLAAFCHENDIRLIHIGSGCIFDGPSPNHQSHFDPYTRDSYRPLVDWGFRESDNPNPVSLYARSKLAADLVLQSYKNTTILRIRMPISDKHHPRNLISKLVGYKRVVETENSITPMNDLSRCIDFVIQKELTGIWHVVNPTPIKHSQILEEYRKHDPSHQYQKMSIQEMDQMTKAKRSNCILSSEKLIHKGFQFQPMEEVIPEYVKRFVDNQ